MRESLERLSPALVSSDMTIRAGIGDADMVAALGLAGRVYPMASPLIRMYLAGDIIYETVQRNCVLYAAAWIEAAAPCDALLDAYHSGMKVWMNGEVVCNAPYGFPKGVRLSMAPVPAALSKRTVPETSSKRARLIDAPLWSMAKVA